MNFKNLRFQLSFVMVFSFLIFCGCNKTAKKEKSGKKPEKVRENPKTAKNLRGYQGYGGSWEEEQRRKEIKVVDQKTQSQLDKLRKLRLQYERLKKRPQKLSQGLSTVDISETGLDLNEVRAVIRAHRREVHHCYQKGLMINAKLKGKIRVAFDLKNNGRISKCSVLNHLSVRKVANCICGRLRTWRYPRPKKKVSISYSWHFSPN